MVVGLTLLTGTSAPVEYARGEEVRLQRGAREHTLRLRQPAPKRGTILRIEETHFDHDSALTLPSAVPAVATALSLLWEARVVAGERYVISIIGHTDRSGPDAYNDRLSRARAESVRDLLLGRVEAWAARAAAAPAPAQARALLHVLAWAAERLGWSDCAASVPPEGAPAALGPAETQALRAFERRALSYLDRVGAPRGVLDVDAWRLVADLHEARLRGVHTGLSAERLAQVRAAVEFVDGQDALGLGERVARAAGTPDGLRQASDRRVDIVIFEPKDAPTAARIEEIYDPKRWALRDVAAREPSTVFGKELPEGDLVFLLDASGSMVANGLGGSSERNNRLTLCQQQLVAMLDALPPARRFAIVAFTSALRPFRGTADRPERVEATAGNREAAKAFVLGLRPAGGTQAMGRALRNALRTPGVGAVILLSDGLPDGEPTALAAEVRGWNPVRADSPTGRRLAVINTYGFERGNEDGVALMRRLAEEHQGVFTPLQESTAFFPDDRVHVTVHLAGSFAGLGRHGDLATDADRAAFAAELVAGVQRVFDQVHVRLTHDVRAHDAAAIRRVGDGLLDAQGRAQCVEAAGRHALAPAGVDLWGELSVEGGQGVDLFLVHHFEEEGVLGKSPTPGRLGGRGPRTALVVGAWALLGGALAARTTEQLAVTAAHELGHFFGLRHTTSFGPDGPEDDGIEDTPCCTGGASGKACPDAENLMFPSDEGGRGLLTKGQERVVRNYLAIHEH